MTHWRNEGRENWWLPFIDVTALEAERLGIPNGRYVYVEALARFATEIDDGELANLAGRLASVPNSAGRPA